MLGRCEREKCAGQSGLRRRLSDVGVASARPYSGRCLLTSRPASLGHDAGHAPPEITSGPPAALPRIRVHDLERVLQPRVLELRDVRRCGREARSRVRRAPALVQVELVGGVDREGREVGGWRCRGRGRVGRASSNGRGDTWVGGCDEITPDGCRWCKY